MGRTPRPSSTQSGRQRAQVHGGNGSNGGGGGTPRWCAASQRESRAPCCAMQRAVEAADATSLQVSIAGRKAKLRVRASWCARTQHGVMSTVALFAGLLGSRRAQFHARAASVSSFGRRKRLCKLGERCWPGVRRRRRCGPPFGASLALTLRASNDKACACSYQQHQQQQQRQLPHARVLLQPPTTQTRPSWCASARESSSAACSRTVHVGLVRCRHSCALDSCPAAGEFAPVAFFSGVSG